MPAVKLPKHWSPEQATAVTEFLSMLLGEIEDYYQDPLLDLMDAEFVPQDKLPLPPPVGHDDFSEDIPF